MWRDGVLFPLTSQCIRWHSDSRNTSLPLEKDNVFVIFLLPLPSELTLQPDRQNIELPCQSFQVKLSEEACIYNIFFFAGWWLSMDPGDAFPAKFGGDFQDLCKTLRTNRFENTDGGKKTLGLRVVHFFFLRTLNFLFIYFIIVMTECILLLYFLKRFRYI